MISLFSLLSSWRTAVGFTSDPPLPLDVTLLENAYDDIRDQIYLLCIKFEPFMWLKASTINSALDSWGKV